MNSILQGESFISRSHSERWDKIYMGLKEFTAARLTELGRNPFEAARIGGLERTFVRDILIDRKKTVLGVNLAKLAAALDTTPEAIAGAMSRKAGAGLAPSEARSPTAVQDYWNGVDDVGLASGRRAPNPADFPRQLPVYGTAPAPAEIGKAVKCDAFVIRPDQPINFVGKPPSLAGVADAYVIYVVGDSMMPEHNPGEPRVVDPHRPVRPGDTVLLQVEEAPGNKRFYLRTFNGRTGEWIVTSRRKPAGSDRFKTSTVTAMHRVLTQADLLGA